MSVKNTVIKLSALAVVNKLQHADSQTVPEISKIYDGILKNETGWKRLMRDVFHTQAFRQGVRDVLTTPAYVIETLISRNPPSRPVRTKPESDALLWFAIGQYCAQNPDVAAKADLSDAEQQKIRGLMSAAQTKPRGEEYAFKAG